MAASRHSTTFPFYIPIAYPGSRYFYSKEVIHNGKPEIIPELEAEKAANEKKVAQLQHQNERLTNRIRYLNKGDRNRRTHRLCARMGYIEHCAPELQKLTEAEFYDLFEHLLRQPDVKSVIERAVRGHSKGIASLWTPRHLLRQWYPDSKNAVCHHCS